MTFAKWRNRARWKIPTFEQLNGTMWHFTAPVSYFSPSQHHPYCNQQNPDWSNIHNIHIQNRLDKQIANNCHLVAEAVLDHSRSVEPLPPVTIPTLKQLSPPRFKNLEGSCLLKESPWHVLYYTSFLHSRAPLIRLALNYSDSNSIKTPSIKDRQRASE